MAHKHTEKALRLKHSSSPGLASTVRVDFKPVLSGLENGADDISEGMSIFDLSTGR